jgi:hypothetical protein
MVSPLSIKEQISDLETRIANFDVSQHFTESDFETYLNETLEPAIICGMEFSQGTALLNLDPVAFREAYNDYLDYIDPETIDEYKEMLSELEDLEYALEEECED